jgi:hypothetical protein
MSKKLFYTIIALVALILLIVHISTSPFLDNQKDRRIWTNILEDFNTLGVESIYIDPNFVSPHALTTEIQREGLDILKNARFLKSNRVKHGPTPEKGSFIVKLPGDIFIRFTSWGETFEVTEITKGPSKYDHEVQFLIESPALGVWFDYAVAYAQSQAAEDPTSYGTDHQVPNQAEDDFNEATTEHLLEVENLHVALSEHLEGFTLSFQEQANQEASPYLSQTILPPTENGPIVHLIRRMYRTELISWYRKDAVIVYPDTKEVRIVPLTNTNVLDQEYAVDSAVKVYGYVNDVQLLYVTAEIDERVNKLLFHVASLDVADGSTEVLFPSFWSIPNPDGSNEFISQGWMTENRDHLVLNSFSEGKTWVFNTRETSMSLLASRFPNAWPISLVYPSLNGESFWHESLEGNIRLYDLTGQLEKTIRFDHGFIQYPRITWSPDSRYAVYQYTFDKDYREHITESGDIDIYNTQGIQILDLNGVAVQKFEVEPNSKWKVKMMGWLQDKVLLHFYQVERKEGEAPQKVASTYKLGDIESGQLVELNKATSFSMIKKPSLLEPSIQDFDRSLWVQFVDIEHQLYWELPESMQLVTDATNKKIYLKHNNYEKEEYILYQFDPFTNQFNSLIDLRNPYQHYIYQDQWLIEDDSWNHHIFYTDLTKK